MSVTVCLLGLVTVPVAFALTFVMWQISQARGLMDVPNKRSSHAIPTPRGGGVAIVISSTVAFGILGALRVVEIDLLVALVGGGLAVALVGLVDDSRPLPARVRLIVHVAAALWAVAWLGRPLGLQLPGHGIFYEAVGCLLAVLSIVWTLNLYNFMDGIDGIAASEAAFVAWAGAAVLMVVGGSGSVISLALVFGCACSGFLLWNWPPAKIFMGDVGSGYLGYVISVLALAAARGRPESLWTWLILGGVFFVDATVTLARRLVRGERVYEAHRSHAYQWLSRRWGSHKSVTMSVLALNFFWLLPCAGFAAIFPEWDLWAVLAALIPLGVGALMAGAGRRESV